jgi:hypothetical protein
MSDNSWIKIYRKIVDWEWYTDSHMVHLYIHLTMKANTKDRRWRGIEVRRGQLITSLESLKSETGISIRSLRTCLGRLQETGEILQEATNKYRIITICKYESYQQAVTPERQASDKQATSKRQSNDNQTTTTKEYKNIKNKEFDAVSCAREGSEIESQEDETSEEEERVLGYQTEILKSQITIEQTCMTLHITERQYQGLIRDFTAEQLAKGTAYYAFADYRRHAYDWIRAHIAANEIDQDGHTTETKTAKQKGQSNGNDNTRSGQGHGYDGLSPKDRAIREANRRDRIAMGLDPDPEPTTYGNDFEF